MSENEKYRITEITSKGFKLNKYFISLKDAMSLRDKLRDSVPLKQRLTNAVRVCKKKGQKEKNIKNSISI